MLSKTVGDSTAILIEDSVKDSIAVSQAVGVLDWACHLIYLIFTPSEVNCEKLSHCVVLS